MRVVPVVRFPSEALNFSELNFNGKLSKKFFTQFSTKKFTEKFNVTEESNHELSKKKYQKD